MKVVFDRPAISDIESIAAYIAADNPAAARRLVSLIRTSAELLGDFPYLGRPGRKDGTYERWVRGSRYVIVYRVDEDADRVLVLAVFHGAQRR